VLIIIITIITLLLMLLRLLLRLPLRILLPLLPPILLLLPLLQLVSLLLLPLLLSFKSMFLRSAYEQALVCLSNRKLVDASRGRKFPCTMANNGLITVVSFNCVGLIYLAI